IFVMANFLKRGLILTIFAVISTMLFSPLSAQPTEAIVHLAEVVPLLRGIGSVAWLPDSLKLMVAGRNNIWHYTLGGEIPDAFEAESLPHFEIIKWIIWLSPEEFLVGGFLQSAIASDEGAIARINTNAWEITDSWAKNSIGVWALALNRRENWVAEGTALGNGRIYDLNNQTYISHFLPNYHKAILDLAWHEDTSYLYVVGEDGLYIWDVPNATLIAQFQGIASTLAISPAQDKLLWPNYPNTEDSNAPQATLFTIEDGLLVNPQLIDVGGYSIEWHPRCNNIVAAKSSDLITRIWDLETHTIIASMGEDRPWGLEDGVKRNDLLVQGALDWDTSGRYLAEVDVR
ncbi:MAG: hypothetical protein D6712_15800, partial [Chloroflexi bacterium]